MRRQISVVVMMCACILGLTQYAAGAKLPNQKDANPQATASDTDTVLIEALIDGVSELVVSPTGISWRNYRWAKPGRHNGRNEPTWVNGKAWKPKWKRPRVERGSDVTQELPLAIGKTSYKLEVLSIGRSRKARGTQNRGPIKARQRGKNFVVAINDAAGSSAWYRFRLVRCDLVTGPDAVTAESNSYAEAFKDLHEKLGRRYPGLKLKKIDWDNVGKELLPRARKIKTDERFGLLCMELIAKLKDGHAVLVGGKAKVPSPPLPRWGPGFSCLVDDRGNPVVYYVDSNGPAKRAGIKVGMTVVSVNGKLAEKALGDSMARLGKYYGYSSKRHLQYDAARNFLRQKRKGKRVRIVLRNTRGKVYRKAIPATVAPRYLPRLPVPIDGVPDARSVSWTKLKGNIGYIYVRRIRGDLLASLDRAVSELAGVKGMILDVRGNSGGGFDGKRAFRNFDVDTPAEPGRSRFDGPMALLINGRCISAGEGWASWFVAKKRARVFGTATAGASGRKMTLPIGDGLFNVRFPRKFYRGYLDRIIELRGIEPDQPIRQTAKDLAKRRDTVLEAARAYLKKAARNPVAADD